MKSETWGGTRGLKKGFEIYYFDGKGGRQGPIDFEELMTMLGAMDEERAVDDDTLYEQFTLPLHSTSVEEEGLVPNREPAEQAGAGTRDPFAEGTQ